MSEQTKIGKTQALKPALIVISMLLILIPVTSIGVDMFGWFNRVEVTLSSPVKGNLHDKGKPLSNVTITRELIYGKEYIDTTVTDDEGNFYFPEKVIKSSKPNNMLDNDVLRQRLYILQDSEEVHLWLVRVILGDANDLTLTKNLKNLKCDISVEPQTFYVPIDSVKDSEYAIHSSCNIK